MSLSKRELTLALGTGAVVIVLGTWLAAEPMWKAVQKSRTRQTQLRNEKAVLEHLIGQRGSLQKDLEELRAQLPRFSPEEQVSAEIVSRIQTIASQHNVNLPAKEPSAEETIGDISEVAVECRWEGELEGITHFLHTVQSQGAMLDVRELSIQPAQNTTQAGRLRGTFKLFYAFMREKPGTPKPSTAVATNAPPAVATNAPSPVATTNAPAPAAGPGTNGPNVEAVATTAPPAAPSAPAAKPAAAPPPGQQEGK